MPESKKALHRYKILNGLLKNSFGHTIKELTTKVNEEMGKMESEGKANYTVTDRMIRIDLQNMMDIFPVSIVKKGNKFFYEDAEDSIDNINLHERDKIAIDFAIDVFTRFKGIPLYEKFSDVITRVIASSLLRKVNTSDSKKYIHLSDTPACSGVEWIEQVYQSIIEKKAITIKYKSFEEKISVKVISPYLLKEYRNNWYLIANLHNSRTGNILMYKLGRIIEIQLANENYTEDPTFDGNKYLKYTLGVFHRHGEEPIDVKCRIRGKHMIRLFSEDKIHPTQRIENISEEECLLSFTVFDSPELETFIMGYAHCLEVISPLPLRNKIIELLDTSFKNYKK